MTRRVGPGLAWLTAALFGAAALSQAKVQIFGRSTILDRAIDSHRYTRTAVDIASRGAILTSDGKALAENETGSQLCVDFGNVPKSTAFFTALSAASGIPLAEFEGKSTGDQTSCWSGSLGQMQSLDVRKVKEMWRADGIGLGSSDKRIYPFGDQAAGIVGAVKSGRSLDGIEGAADKALAGKNGTEEGWIDRTGSFLPYASTAITKKQDGEDVVTTIDSVMQTAASLAIRNAVEKYNAVNGCAIVMDPNNGNIIAMANWPTFVPTPTPGTPPPARASDLDPAYMARMEPGSMFKILTLACALDSGAIGLNWQMYCPGDKKIGGIARVRCAEEHGQRAHGQVDLEEAIAKSCNISAATWATTVGSTKFIDFVKHAGVLDAPDLGLKGEIHGFYDKNDPGKFVQTADMGFGQSMTCVPVSLAASFAAIANGGMLVRPRLIAEIGGKAQPYKAAEPIITPQTAKTVFGYMESVFDKPYGTGHSLKIPGYSMAGKTGTAQIQNGGHGYESNFVGFLPASKPQFEILVMINNPRQGGYYGAQVAGPVYRQLAITAIQRYNIAPDQPTAPPKAKASATGKP